MAVTVRYMRDFRIEKNIGVRLKQHNLDTHKHHWIKTHNTKMQVKKKDL